MSNECKDVVVVNGNIRIVIDLKYAGQKYVNGEPNDEALPEMNVFLLKDNVMDEAIALPERAIHLFMAGSAINMIFESLMDSVVTGEIEPSES